MATLEELFTELQSLVADDPDHEAALKVIQKSECVERAIFPSLFFLSLAGNFQCSLIIAIVCHEHENPPPLSPTLCICESELEPVEQGNQ